MTAIIVLSALAIKVTSGFFAAAIVLAGVAWGLQGQTGKALCCYVMLPYFVIFNNFLLPITRPLIMSARFGVLLMGLAMMIGATKQRSSYTIPLASIFFYLLFASVSSLTGYCPKVSLLKLINFSIFVVGLCFGCRNLDRQPHALSQLRYFFVALCLVMAVGSLLVLPFPAIAYCTSSSYLVEAYGVEEAGEILATRGTGEALFSGLTSHSQTLAPEMAMIIVFLLADMFFVERKGSPLHLFALICSFACLFMTRSRTGLVSMSIGIFILCMITVRKVRIPPQQLRRIKSLVGLFVVGVIVVAAVAEVRNKTMTRWLRKGDGLDSDKTMVESVTASRMGAVEELLDDFHKNPVLGMGFQVNAASARFNGQGFVLSAPVEKGLLPMVIIGEGGIVGAISFLVFLVVFFSGCARQKLYMTALTFATLLATNLGEATFFSPGAVGGILWVFGVVGGVTLDAMVRVRTRMEEQNVQW